jgi:hypothetical protein
LKPAPDKWSPKEELGHLIDSAANNHQRIVRAQLENSPAMPDYNGDDWVRLHSYQAREWDELIGVWLAFNHQLVAAAEAARPATWTRTCTIAGSEPLTASFVLGDYLEHLLHHIRHIGVNTDDFLASTRS